MSGSGWLQKLAVGGLALVLCAAAPASEKPDAGKPAEHHAEGAAQAASQPAAQQQTAPPAPPSEQVTKADPRPAAAKKDAAEHKPESPKWTDRAQALSAVMVMLLTAVLTFVAWEQRKRPKASNEERVDALKVAKNAADAAKLAAEATLSLANSPKVTQRAFVHFDKIEWEPHPSDPVGWQLTVIWKNSGPTAAVEVSFDDTGLTEDLPDVDPSPAPGPHPTIIAGGGHGKALTPVMVIGLAQALWRKERRAFLQLRCRYRDIFEGTPEHKSTVAMELFVESNPAMRDAVLRWKIMSTTQN